MLWNSPQGENLLDICARALGMIVQYHIELFLFLLFIINMKTSFPTPVSACNNHSTEFSANAGFFSSTEELQMSYGVMEHYIV